MLVVSVIVPVYNVEPYIDKCVTSILKQTYDDWELVLVDDGSQDRSGKICDQYAKKNSRIRVIHQRNQGVSVARNTGIEFSRGKYILFLDADDYLSKRYLEHMVSCIEAFSADVAVGNMYKVGVSGAIVGFQDKIDDEVAITSDAAMEQCLYERHLSPSVCGKMFRRGVWGKIFFPRDCVLAEDIWALYNVLKTAKNVALCDKAIYYAYLRDGSAQRSEFSPHKISALDVCEKIMEDAYQNSRLDIYKAAIAKLVAVSFHILLQLPAEMSAIYHDRCWREIKKYRCRVILDSKTKTKTRGACLLSFMGKGVMKSLFVLLQRTK